MLAARAEGTADEIGRVDNADNLFAPVAGAGGQLEYALDDIGDEQGIIALPHQSLTGGDGPRPADAVQRSDFLGIQHRTNGAIADEAGVAGAHAAGLAAGLSESKQMALAPFGD